MKVCYRCGKELALGRETGRRDECPFCRADLHCCRNCRFYDAAAPKQCREPAAELVRDKEKANFCDFFQFGGGRSEADSPAERTRARAAADDLFKR